jgi:FlaA1/EpsC-like NDP-sugar epimerase
MRRVVEYCERAHVPFRTLPRMEDLVSGQVTVNALREVSIEDLLGREPVPLDWDEVRASVRGRTVLVTGGAGSIGSELCHQLARLEPGRLVVLDKSESDLYHVEQELRRLLPPERLVLRLADVCDRPAVARLMAQARPEVVFHAAAYKHVPMLESQAREAARNNVLGTLNVAQLAQEHGCGTFVLISTDKAVNPTNVMGATKRMAELACRDLHRRGPTRFLTVRFGNVLGSAGSVVPLFRDQIAAGGPVTVTHPDVIRYFMTITEACQLILQAAALAEGGEIFVLDMGEPIRIRYLAEQMILLSGRVPGEDVEIVYTGLRPGEKLREELFYGHESLVSTRHSKILCAHDDRLDGRVREVLEALERACEAFDDAMVESLLGDVVPEFRRSRGVANESKVVRLGKAK